MQGHTSISRLLIGFCILLLVAVLTNVGFAQEQQLLRVTVLQVNPGMQFDKIIDEANFSERPVSPDRVLIGLGAGLVLRIGAALVRELSDAPKTR